MNPPKGPGSLTAGQLNERIQLRLECARIAAQFFPELRDGVRIEQACGYVYAWVTKEEDD